MWSQTLNVVYYEIPSNGWSSTSGSSVELQQCVITTELKTNLYVWSSLVDIQKQCLWFNPLTYIKINAQLLVPFWSLVTQDNPLNLTGQRIMNN